MGEEGEDPLGGKPRQFTHRHVGSNPGTHWSLRGAGGRSGWAHRPIGGQRSFVIHKPRHGFGKLPGVLGVTAHSVESQRASAGKGVTTGTFIVPASRKPASLGHEAACCRGVPALTLFSGRRRSQALRSLIDPGRAQARLWCLKRRFVFNK